MATKRYLYYSIIKFQTSLSRNAEHIPLAVVTVSPSQGKVMVMGENPSRPEGISDMSWAIIENVPAILREQVEDALKTVPLEDLLDELSNRNRWNLYITPVKKHQATSIFELEVSRLFFKNVAKGPSSLSRRQRIKSQVMKQDFFTLVPALPAVPA